MRALIYARISPASADKNAPKTANQIADCRKLAVKHDYIVVEPPFVDDNLSASTGKARPDFERLLEAVTAGKADVVLATEEERFARNVGDKERLSFACIASSTTWHTIRDGQVNPADASGELMSTLRAAIGRMESRRKAERQVAANAHRRALGERYMQGPRIFGWMDDKATLEKAEADLIKAGTKMILQGSTIYRVCMMFRESGVKPIRAQAWQTVAVKNMLCRWSNAAVVSYKDEPMGEGNWQPIVSRKDLEKVRTILKRKGLARNRAQSLATGIARCVCGATMVGSGANGKKFYVCTAQRAGTKNGGLHSSILFNLLDDKITEEICQAYLEEPESVTEDNSELSRLYEKLHDLQKQQEDLLDLHLEGTLTKPLYVKKNQGLAKQIDDVETQINKLASQSAHNSMLVESRKKLFDQSRLDAIKPVNGVLIPRRGFKPVLDDLKAAFEALDLEEQRALVKDRLNIVVNPGRGAERVTVTRRTVPSAA